MSNDVLLIALYLPQYHRIKENDQWWGDGYTEWTAVKKARALFPGHKQPKKPLGDNYYDLSDINAMRWQQGLAKKYGVYGFCYYHYWFKGRRLLEKPVEKMLATNDLTLPFCLAWANPSWTRTWYGQANEVLMQQDYGGKPDWKEHFEYLLPIFRDSRYIQLDGKPVFVIHDSSTIADCSEMLDYWKNLAMNHGLNGLYIVQTLGGFSLDRRKLPFDAQLQFEPGYTMVNDMPAFWKMKQNAVNTIRAQLRKCSYKDNNIDIIWNYDKVYERITNRPIQDEIPTFIGAFTDWDNSPRRQYRSSVFTGATPEKFERYLTQQINRSKHSAKTKCIFINAWNEWGEGAYLEPDEHNQYGFLEAVRRASINTGILKP